MRMNSRAAEALAFIGLLACSSVAISDESTARSDAIRQLIKRLRDDSFQVREAASRKLNRSEDAWSELVTAANDSRDLESLHRARFILRSMLCRECVLERFLDATNPLSRDRARLPDSLLKDATVATSITRYLGQLMKIERDARLRSHSILVAGYVRGAWELAARSRSIQDRYGEHFDPSKRIAELEVIEARCQARCNSSLPELRTWNLDGKSPAASLCLAQCAAKQVVWPRS